MRLKNLSLFVTGSLAMLLFAEAALRALPVAATPLPDETFHPDFPVDRWQQGEPYVYSRGVYLERPHTLYPNDMGMLHGGKADTGFTLWVHGDSYVEAAMLDFGQTLQGNLTTLAKGSFAVASVNVSGATLADYLTGIRLGSGISRRSAHVVLISAGDLAESFAPMDKGAPEQSALMVSPDGVRIHLRHGTPRPSAPLLSMRTIWKVARKSALFRYVYLNIKFQPTNLLKSGANNRAALKESASADTVPDYYPKGVAALLDSIASASSHVLFLVDCNRAALAKSLLEGKAVLPPRRDTLAAIFENIARARNIPVVDMCPIFADWMARNRRTLDFRPADAHWDKDAQALAANAAFAILSEKRWLPAPGQKVSLPDSRAATNPQP
ncbi:MAG TPA: hypothetical protein VHO02_08490 [Fibrobacteria bacterium]|nr:hypothetical protein [Fibrobacteria bacterium]